jgi:hypothetical protein
LAFILVAATLAATFIMSLSTIHEMPKAAVELIEKTQYEVPDCDIQHVLDEYINPHLEHSGTHSKGHCPSDEQLDVGHGSTRAQQQHDDLLVFRLSRPKSSSNDMHDQFYFPTSVKPAHQASFKTQTNTQGT